MRDRRRIAIGVVSFLTFFALANQAANGLRMTSDKWPLTGYRMFAGGGTTGRYELEATTRSGGQLRITGADFGVNGRQLRAYLEFRAINKPGGRARVRAHLATLASIWNRRHAADPATVLILRVYDVPPPPAPHRLASITTWAQP